MQWEEFLQHKLPLNPIVTRVKTDIECPKCKRNLWKRMDIVLTSDPPKYQYECECGWVGYHTI